MYNFLIFPLDLVGRTCWLGKWDIIFVTILAVVCLLLRLPYTTSIIIVYPRCTMLAEKDFDDFSVMFQKLYPVHRTTNSLCKIVGSITSVWLCSMSSIHLSPPFPRNWMCCIPRWCFTTITKRRQVWRCFEKKALELCFKGVIHVWRDHLSRKVHASDLNSDGNMYKKNSSQVRPTQPVVRLVGSCALRILDALFW